MEAELLKKKKETQNWKSQMQKTQNLKNPENPKTPTDWRWKFQKGAAVQVSKRQFFARWLDQNGVAFY